MHQISDNIQVSQPLYDFANSLNGNADKAFSDFADLVREFKSRNDDLLAERDNIQNIVDEFFNSSQGEETAAQVVNKLKEIGYISQNSDLNDKVTTTDIAEEISPMAGPQLVVPADKVNMVLNAANARWQSLYNSLYASNIIDEALKDKEREQAVINYTNDFLDKIVTFENNTSWNDIATFTFDQDSKKFHGNTADGTALSLAEDKLVGVTFNDQMLTSFILENNGLKIEFILDEQKIKDIQLEAAITYIIDLEDASISAPENKYEGYRILQGIHNGDLQCEVRGKTRKIKSDTEYLDAKTLETKILKRSSIALVRDVGPHMMADREIITIDDQHVPEKLLDCFITSLIGHRYHVAPKMHGAAEVAFNVDLWHRINELQGLPKNANKIGIMNEEMRTNAQLADCALAAKDIVFFTNTGFLDYTGSFIDLMMHQGAIAPYRNLPSQLYKNSYEVHNVNISLDLKVPQIGAGMWAAIKDMSGLLKSKEGQVKGLTDTGWSPSPTAAGIHAMAFHVYGNVRQMQDEYRQQIKDVNLEELFTFPRADLASLNDKEKIENLDFAIHGLLAYAEPWVRRSIGCSGVKELSGEPLMEDRATARIKAAFVRNWLLHKVVTADQVEDSIKRMSKLVDEQNADEEDYKPVYTAALDTSNWSDAEETVKAVHELVFNNKDLKASYVEPYFYPANRREHGKGDC